MSSGVAAGGAADIAATYRPYLSRTMRVGLSVPILYLRTTTGARGDWTFDPDFDVAHKCKDRPVAEDALNGVIAFAVANDLPVQFILNGGIWADASCDIPEWDVNDHLEQDAANCQWTQDNEVLARRLPPEPARLHAVARAGAQPHLQRLCDQGPPLQAAQPAGGGRHHRRLRARAPDAVRRRGPRRRHLHESVRARRTLVRLQPRHAEAVPPLARRQRAVRRRRRTWRARSVVVPPRARAVAGGRESTRAPAMDVVGRRRSAAHVSGSRRDAGSAGREALLGRSLVHRMGQLSQAHRRACTTTSSRAGSTRWASPATASFRRRRSLRPMPAGGPSRCTSAGRVRTTIPPACRSRVRFRARVTWERSCTAPPPRIGTR